jgi:hypothetical protein
MAPTGDQPSGRGGLARRPLDGSTPIADLRSAARELSVNGWARLPKDELVEAIRKVDRR